MNRLLVTDLDGTLLDASGLVHERDAEAVRALRQRGIHVALCTGRLFSGTRHVADHLELDGPVACCDGSHIVDAHTGRALYSSTLETLELSRALGELERAGLVTFVFAGDAVYHDPRGADLLSYVSLWSRDCFQLPLVTDASRWAGDESVVSLVSLGPSQRVRAAAERITQTTRLSCAWFEVNRTGYEGQWGLVVRNNAASKGTAVEWLAQHYGVQRDAVAVVGDWLNDLPMFQWAQHAFAMAQAPDEVKRAASQVLSADSERGGGIAEAARRMGWLE